MARFTLKRVGGGELGSPQPERGMVWKPCQGFHLNRRTFLRGVGGAAVALPPLEVMTRGSARAAAPPGRFLIAYGGISIGAERPISENPTIPKETGTDYTLTRGLTPLAGGTIQAPLAGGAGDSYPSVRKDVGVISGLCMNWDWPNPGPAGVAAKFHYITHWPVMSGERIYRPTEEASGDPGRGHTGAPASTADQIVAGIIGQSTPHRSLALRAQALEYWENNGISGYFLPYKDGRMLQPIISPRQAYNDIFGGGVVNGRTIDVASFVDRRKSILDAILDKSRNLNRRLGAQDRRQLDLYYTNIRDLEMSLERLKETGGTLQCRPPEPPEDASMRGEIFDLVGFRAKNAGQDPATYGLEDNYSDEETRARLLSDFLYLAFACDLTRSATLQLTMPSCGMGFHHPLGAPFNMPGHTYSHCASPVDIGMNADCVAWHVKHFCRLAYNLKRTIDPLDGRSVLDHTAMSLIFEGGHGPGADDGGSNPLSSHAVENMIMVVAGGAGGLKSAQHIHYRDKNHHPAQVIREHMYAVGVPETTPFGEINEANGWGRLPELYTLA